MATKVAIEVDVKTGEANDDIIALREELEKVKSTQEKLSNEMKAGFQSAEKGAKGASKGMKGFGTSIGGVLKSLGLIAVAMEVFNFLKELLMKNQKVVDTLAIAFKAIEVLFNQLFKAVEPLGGALMDAFENPQQALEDLWEAIKTNFLNRVNGIAVAAEGVGKVIKAAFELDWDGVKEGMQQYGQALVQVTTGLGIEQQNEFVNGIANAGREAIDTATKIETLRKEVKLAEAQQGLLILEYQREAEIQRQIRDDVSLTLEKRKAANKELGRILDEQTQEELKLANKRLELALLEQSTNKDSVDAEIEVINARKEIADINERITGQRSEQLTNENALIQENIDKQKEKAELEAEAALAAAERRLQIERELADSRIALIQDEELRRIMEVEANLERKLAEIVEEDAQAKELKANLEQIAQAEILQIQQEFRDKELELLEAQAKKKKELEDKAVADVKKAEEEKQKAREAGLKGTSDVLGALGGLIEASGNNSKQAVAIQKTLAIAQIAIDTATAVSGAIAQAQKTGPFPANIAAIATGVAAVIAGISSAVSTLNTANVPGGSAPAPTPPQITSAPAIQPVTTNTTELGGAEQAQLAPIQAYVVETEVTGNQNNISQIESQATFPG
jgi:hypothetical protein